MTLTLDLKVSQQREALALANETRFATGAWKRRTRRLSTIAGCRTVADLLEREDLTDDILGSLRIAPTLLTIHRFGTKTVNAILADIGVRSSDRRLRDLTARQRLRVAVLLRVHACGLERGQ